MKKLFRKYLVGALFATVVVPVTLNAQRRDDREPREAANLKQLSIQDVEFDPIVVNTSQGKLDTVRVNVLWQRDQFQSIDNKNLKIEARFYSGKDKSQAKRIMKDRDYYLESRSSSFTLAPKEACPSSGKYWAKVWFSVRNKDDSRNNSYDDYEEYYRYTCLDRNKVEPIRAESSFELANQVGRTFKQLNLLVDVSDKQYNRVKGMGEKIEVRLYSIRDDRLYRVGKAKAKYLNNPGKNSFSFNIKDLCGDMSGIWNEIFGKEVEVTCRLSVVDGAGNLNENFEVYNCPTEKFVCD